MSRKKALKIARDIIKNKEDINKRLDEYQNTPLMVAIGANSKKAVKLLIKHGADINLKNINRHSALTIAVIDNNLEIVKLLLENGADTNIILDGNITLIDFAKLNRNEEMIKLIKKYTN